MRDVTEAVFIMELVTVWLVSVPDEKEDPRVNGRVDVPVGSEENVTLVPAGIEVRVTVFVAELPTVWLVSVRADIDALDINVTIFTFVLAMEGVVSVCGENDDPRVD